MRKLCDHPAIELYEITTKGQIILQRRDDPKDRDIWVPDTINTYYFHCMQCGALLEGKWNGQPTEDRPIPKRQPSGLPASESFRPDVGTDEAADADD